MTELEKLLSGSNVTEAATMKAIRAAEKLSALIPKIPDSIRYYARLIKEEEEARRKEQ
jgi:exopolyphosphatase/pppGpp-phosphohydrolase